MDLSINLASSKFLVSFLQIYDVLGIGGKVYLL